MSDFNNIITGNKLKDDLSCSFKVIIFLYEKAIPQEVRSTFVESHLPSIYKKLPMHYYCMLNGYRNWACIKYTGMTM